MEGVMNYLLVLCFLLQLSHGLIKGVHSDDGAPLRNETLEQVDPDDRLSGWYLVELTGNCSALLQAPTEFVYEFRRQLAGLLGRQPWELTVNNVSYKPSLLVNVSVSSDLGLDLPENASLDFQGERLEIAAVFAQNQILVPQKLVRFNRIEENILVFTVGLVVLLVLCLALLVLALSCIGRTSKEPAEDKATLFLIDESSPERGLLQDQNGDVHKVHGSLEQDDYDALERRMYEDQDFGNYSSDSPLPLGRVVSGESITGDDRLEELYPDPFHPDIWSLSRTPTPSTARTPTPSHLRMSTSSIQRTSTLSRPNLRSSSSLSKPSRPLSAPQRPLSALQRPNSRGSGYLRSSSLPKRKRKPPPPPRTDSLGSQYRRNRPLSVPSPFHLSSSVCRPPSTLDFINEMPREQIEEDVQLVLSTLIDTAG